MSSFPNLTKALGLTFFLAVAGISPAFGQLYTFSGTITSSDSPTYSAGESVVLQYHLASPLNAWMSDPVAGVFFYSCDWTSFSVAGNTIPSQSPLTYIAEHDDGNISGSAGETQYDRVTAGQLKRLELEFYSTKNDVTSSDGLLLPNLTISDFEFHSGQFGVLSVDFDNSSEKLTSFDITSYTVSEIPAAPVPEPSTYAAFGSLTLFGLAVWRRLYRK